MTEDRYIFNHKAYSLKDLMDLAQIPRELRWVVSARYEMNKFTLPPRAALAAMIEYYSICKVTRRIASVILLRHKAVEKARAGRWI